MADQITVNYGLIKPEVGSSGDTWGNKLNDNFEIIDVKLGSRTAVSTVIPANPINGDMWFNSDDGVLRVWDGSEWTECVGVTGPPGIPGAAFVGDEPPIGAKTQGHLWWDSDSGNLFVWYDDGSSSQWVQINATGPAGPAGSTGPAGLTGPAGPSFLRWACGDETTPITVGDAKLTDRMPYAFTATGIRASLNVAQTSGIPVGVTMRWWDGDSWENVLSVQISFENGEATSVTSLVQPVLLKTDFADDDLIRIDVTSVGDGTAVGLKVTLLGQKT